jgi:hypothetical protein
VKEELGYWLAVGIAAIVALALFKLLAATKAGDVVPALRDLAAFV